MNQVILMGKLASDPAMKYTPSGLAITEFFLETPATGDRKPDKHKIVCFGKEAGKDGVAGFVAQYLKKGSRALVQGKLSGQENTSKENKVFLNTQVNAFSVEALDKKEEE